MSRGKMRETRAGISIHRNTQNSIMKAEWWKLFFENACDAIHSVDVEWVKQEECKKLKLRLTKMGRGKRFSPAADTLFSFSSIIASAPGFSGLWLGASRRGWGKVKREKRLKSLASMLIDALFLLPAEVKRNISATLRAAVNNGIAIKTRSIEREFPWKRLTSLVSLLFSAAAKTIGGGNFPDLSSSNSIRFLFFLLRLRRAQSLLLSKQFISMFYSFMPLFMSLV